MKRPVFSFHLAILLIAALIGFTIAYAREDSPFFESLQQSWEEGGERAREDFDRPKGHKLVECFQNLQDFLAAAVGYTDFKEYWKDIVRVNLCHRTDVDFTERQLQKARRQVRSAFLRCEVENLPRLTENYYKLEAELFFLRKAFDKTADYLLRDAQGNRLDGPWNSLIQEFKSRGGFYKFTHAWQQPFDRENIIQALFQEFETKYQTRIDTYQNCRAETWEEIGTKWNELVTNLSGIGEVVTDIVHLQPIREGTTRALEETPTKKRPGVWSGPSSATDEGFDLNLGILRGKITPEKTFRDLLAVVKPLGEAVVAVGEGVVEVGGEFVERFKNPPPSQPTVSGGGVPHAEVPAKIEQEKNRFEEEISRAELEAKFTTLYADLSGDATNVFAAKLQNLIDVVTQSVPKLDSIERCVDQIEMKECRNKK